MPYTRFTPAANRARFARWIPMRVLSEFDGVATGNSFSKVEGRRAIRAAFTSMLSRSVTNLYSRTVRFPDDQPYICITMGDWNSKLTQIQEALDFFDDEPEEGSSGSTSPRVRETAQSQSVSRKNWSHNDALHAYYMGRQRAMEQASNGDYVYDRELFEDMFAGWEDEEVQPQPRPVPPARPE